MSIFTRVIDLQNLRRAWEKVKKNKPAAGVDQITYEMFDENREEELKKLQHELKEHIYEALPVKNVILYKGEKERIIALYSMRDKVVQQSLADVLTKIYDSKFSSQTIAYRPNQSAIKAVQEIEQAILHEGYQYVLKTDITHFFDTISWDVLKKILQKTISEDDVIDLIKENTCTRVLEETGEINEKTVGIHQGSAISPLLSNVYLMEFDRLMMGKNVYFVRYSDDMILLGKNKNELLEIFSEIKLTLNQLGLSINESKSICSELKEGVNFLGYAFNENGKCIPQKAKDNLQERLESMWLTSGLDIDDKLKKASEIIGGWEQYFRGEKEIHSIFEYTTLIALSRRNSERMNTLKSERVKLENIYKDIAIYLGNVWKIESDRSMELFEYEQYFQIAQGIKFEYSDEVMEEILSFYRQFLITESEELCVQLMQSYTDVKAYDKASFWMEQKEKYAEYEKTKTVSFANQNPESEEIIYNRNTASKFISTFSGREDAYGLEGFTNNRRRQVEETLLPLTEEIVCKHLSGEKTIGTYVQRPNNTVRFFVIDIDISKKILLQINADHERFQAYLEKARQLSFQVISIYKEMGLTGYVEFSGYRGYHVWLFFNEWLPVRYIHMFSEIIESKLAEKDSDISLEFFPNKTRLKQGKLGQCIKLPYGIHWKTGRRSYFINESGEPFLNLNYLIDSIAKFSLNSIKKILAVNTTYKEPSRENLEFDLVAYGEVKDVVGSVLNQCSLMQYLCSKASQTAYLSHAERLSVLYVFGHLGDSGKEFVHTVMEQTLNYKYHVTERFIQKIPEKPISCIKLRDQYKQISAECGCNCVFKRAKNCYPSPVLHAIEMSKETDENITLPTSRTVPKEKQQQILDDMNIHKKAQELATKIVELKKQRRKLDSSVKKLETELGSIFDQEKIDCLEIDIGLLVRRKTESGDEWVIEI